MPEEEFKLKRRSTKGLECPLTRKSCTNECAWASIINEEPYCAMRLLGDSSFVEALAKEQW
jgi:hypothetical protein